MGGERVGGATGGMITVLIFALIATLTCGYIGGRVLLREFALTRTRRLSSPGKGRVCFGVRLFRGPAKGILERASSARSLAKKAQKVLLFRGIEMDESGIFSCVLAAMVGTGLLAGVLGRSVFWLAVGAAAVPIGVGVWAGNREAQDREVLREQTSEVVRALGRSVQAGMTLPQMFAHVADEVRGYLGNLFSHAADMMETGSSAEEALAFIRERCEVRELSFLVIALDVQHQTGGSMSRVLETAQEAVVAQVDMARHLQTQTSQARLSAEVVTVLPFVLLAILSLMSPGVLDPLFAGVAGYAVLTVAALLQVAGVLVVRRILKEARA